MGTWELSVLSPRAVLVDRMIRVELGNIIGRFYL